MTSSSSQGRWEGDDVANRGLRRRYGYVEGIEEPRLGPTGLLGLCVSRLLKRFEIQVAPHEFDARRRLQVHLEAPEQRGAQKVPVAARVLAPTSEDRLRRRKAPQTRQKRFDSSEVKHYAAPRVHVRRSDIRRRPRVLTPRAASSLREVAAGDARHVRRVAFCAKKWSGREAGRGVPRSVRARHRGAARRLPQGHVPAVALGCPRSIS